MLKQLFVMALVLAMLPAGASAQGANGFSLAYPHFSLSVPLGASGAQGVALVQAKVDSGMGNPKEHYFGLAYRGDDAKNAGAATVLQILDASTGKSLKNVTADEYFGKESAAWKAAAADSKTSANESIAAYTVTSGKQSFEVIRAISTVNDEHLPGGKAITVQFSLRSEKGMSVKAKFSYKADDNVGNTTGAFLIGSRQTIDGAVPAIIASVSPAAQLSVTTPKKNGPSTISATTGTVRVPAGIATPVYAMTFVGTALRAKDHLRKQAENLKSYFDKKKSAPELVAVTVSSKKAARAGDTVAYTIYYHNIGTSAGAEIEVNNPITPGMTYIQGSAEGQGSEIAFGKTAGTETVKNISWKFTNPILPGEERAVSFKVVVR